MKVSKSKSLLIVLVGYALAFLAARIYFMFATGDLYLDVLLADISATVVIFIFSVALKNSSMYDPFWSVAPPIIAVYLMGYFTDGNDVRSYFVLAGTMFWGIRLTVNWIRSWPGLHHEDFRYEELAEQSGKWYWLVSFSGIHLFPTLIVYLGCLPMFFAFNMGGPIGIWDYLGLAITILGTVIELVADEQMRVFKKTAPKGSIMTSGLWRYSRHPNYFGEITFWFGLWLFMIPDSGLWWTAIGWIAMVILFVFASVPMMDRRSLKNKPGYEEHMKNSTALFPSLKKLFAK
ncbi:MAG: DUF1295 domain-containing protein [Bacteroidota bacterium]